MRPGERGRERPPVGGGDRWWARAGRDVAGAASPPVDPIAVVSVADDGGSTGRLRADADRAALGDLRKCLLALAGRATPLTRVMEHRFDAGELKGHSFGNLMLAALEESEGDLLDAARGHFGAVAARPVDVLPATSDFVELEATLQDGTEIVGQAEIARTARGAAGLASSGAQDMPRGARRGSRSRCCRAGARLALHIGSRRGGRAGARRCGSGGAECPVVYVCNLRPQAHETDGYDVADTWMRWYDTASSPTCVLYDPSRIGGAEDVPGARCCRRLAGPSGLAHDPGLLAAALRRRVGLRLNRHARIGDHNGHFWSDGAGSL